MTFCRNIGCAAALAALLAPGCGGGGQAPGGEGWILAIRPRVAAALAGRPGRLRAWGPWWTRLWSASFQVPPAGGAVRVAPGDHLERIHWLTLEAGGEILCGARLPEGAGPGPVRLEAEEVEVARSALPPPAPSGPPLAGAARPRGFPGGGVAGDRGDRAALRVLASPDLPLRALWLLPWRGEGGRYAVAQVDNETRPDEGLWELGGGRPAPLLPAAGVSVLASGCDREPWPAPAGLHPGEEGFSFWGPGWDLGGKAALVAGHADWRRLLLLLPREGGAELLPLWDPKPLAGLEEDRPQLLWRLAWSAEAGRLAAVEAWPLGAAAFAPWRGQRQEWAFLVLRNAGEGLAVGSIPLRLEGPARSRPLALLESPRWGRRDGLGLLFFPPGGGSRLAWEPGGSLPLRHQATVAAGPGAAGSLLVEETRSPRR